jgi:hypothetical protein
MCTAFEQSHSFDARGREIEPRVQMERCHECGYSVAVHCVHHGCHEEKAFCADHGTPCVDCAGFYCERHSIEVLNSEQRCENCAYVASIAPEKLCPVCKAQEIGETIPTCLPCHWRAATDGIGKAVASFQRMGAELAGRLA